jgi:hypothetical protein
LIFQIFLNAQIFKKYKKYPQKNPKFFWVFVFFLDIRMEIFGYFGLDLVSGKYPKPNPNPSVCLGTYICTEPKFNI